MNQADVTAIIAVRNGEGTIKRALDSLLNQTAPLQNIIVVDDCSSDRTAIIVNEYTSDKIILIKLAYNHWIYTARNIGTKETISKYIFFLDADDFVDIEYVERLVPVLEEFPDCAFVYPDMIFFGDGEPYSVLLPDFNIPLLAKKNYIPYTAIIRTQDFKALGGYSNYFNDCRNHLCEWQLWLRFALMGKKGIHLDRPLLNYNDEDTNDRMSAIKERNREDMYFQLILSLRPSLVLAKNDSCRILLVCLGRDYCDATKFGFEPYTWLKPLEKFGKVFSFFYDIESRYFGPDKMLERLCSLIDKIQPTHIFHWAYKEHIPVETWKLISEKFNTIVWFSDDRWRFDDYSKKYCQGFRNAITACAESFEQYKAIGYENIFLSQFAANIEYFKDYKLPKDIDVSFCGQNYGDRAAMLHGSGVQCFGRGWPSSMLDFPDMAKVLNRSKISINFSKGADGKSHIKCRLFEIAASNTLPLCEYADGIEKYYELGKEIVTFNTVEEMREQINYYLRHDIERTQIAKAAYERTLKDHIWQNRLKPIFKKTENANLD